MHSGHGYPKLDLSEQLELVQFLEDVLSLVHKASSHKSNPFNLEKNISEKWWWTEAFTVTHLKRSPTPPPSTIQMFTPSHRIL